MRMHSVAFVLNLLATLSCSAGVAQQPAPVTQPDVRDLPLIEVLSPMPRRNVFAVFLTGDGGWATLDRNVTRELTAGGLHVVALNTRDYLWHRRTPEQAALDLARIVRHYQSLWGKQKVVIVGYSRGADIVPFMVSRLPSELKSNVSLLALLAFANTTNFQFHFKDILVESHRPSDLNTLPELEKLRGMNIVCVYGADEKDSACDDAPPGLVKAVPRKGGHHFDDDFKAVGDIVLSAIP